MIPLCNEELGVCVAGIQSTGGVRRTVKERGIKGYGFVQRIMLAAGSGTERGKQAVADTRLRIGAEGRRFA